jgi:hypothetical protein
VTKRRSVQTVRIIDGLADARADAVLMVLACRGLDADDRGPLMQHAMRLEAVLETLQENLEAHFPGCAP